MGYLPSPDLASKRRPMNVRRGDENLHRHVQTASTTAAHACQDYSALISSGQGQGSPVALNVGRWALTERR